MTKLQAVKREGKRDAAGLRADGLVPAIVYGPKQEPISVSVKYNDIEKTFKEAGESTIVELNDGTEDHDVLIHEVQFDPVTDNIIHVDFYAVEKGKKVEVHVPLHFEGISPAEKNLGGILVKVMHEIEIEAMPKDLPHDITIDVSSLDTLESKILAGDIKLPSGVTLVTDPEEVVAAISEAKEEEEESEAFNPDSVEVEDKGKKDEESTEGAE